MGGGGEEKRSSNSSFQVSLEFSSLDVVLFKWCVIVQGVLVLGLTYFRSILLQPYLTLAGELLRRLQAVLKLF